MTTIHKKIACGMHYRSPLLAKLLVCQRLNHPQSSKEILHVVVDLEDSGLCYEVGSSFGIIPENSSSHIEEIFSIFGHQLKNQCIDCHAQNSITLENFFRTEANLSLITSSHVKLFHKYYPHTILDSILQNEAHLHIFIKKHDLVLFLQKFWRPSIPIKEIVKITPPMLPRYFSIASSRKKISSYCEFMIASFIREKCGKKKENVTALFLKEKIAQKNPRIRLFLHPNPSFQLPDDSFPLILIGPGTGLACLRSFLQELAYQNTKKSVWLFTGDRNQMYDFHYKDELLSYVQSGWLKLSTAFSRDQPKKIYVQDRLLENRACIWSWIQDNAYIYISGSAKQMAKDVQNTLLHIVEKEGSLSRQKAVQFMQKMRANKKLCLDVY